MDEIRTWRQRVGVSPDYSLTCATPVELAMVAEIAELRAALEKAKQEKEPA